MRAVLLLAILLTGCTSVPRDFEPPAENTGGPDDATAPPTECPSVTILREQAVWTIPAPVRFKVRIDNCSGAPIDTEPNGCDRDTPGLSVSIGMPEGPRARLSPANDPVPGDGEWSLCEQGEARRTLKPGEVIEHHYAWDGAIEPFCPERVPDEPCGGRREAAPGAHELTAALSTAAGERFATKAIVMVRPSTPRVPVILVTETYNKTSGDEDLPAQGIGCADFATTREPWSATGRADNAAAVVVREFPQRSYGPLGLDGFNLPRGGTLSILSVFDPERVLAVLEATDEGFFLDGQPLAQGEQSVSSAGDVSSDGQTYRVSESVVAKLVGESYLFPLDVAC